MADARRAARQVIFDQNMRESEENPMGLAKDLAIRIADLDHGDLPGEAIHAGYAGRVKS